MLSEPFHTMRILLLAALMLTAFAPGASAQVAKLYPIDEAVQDSSLMLFRLRLIEALVERDTAFVYAHLAPEVKISFGDADGLDSFKMIWQPDAPDSKFWITMAGIIGAGGIYDASPDYGDAEATFIAPYYFAAFPDEYDGFEYAVVVGERVRVRSAPNTDSEILAALSYDIVPLISPSSDGWVQIELADGKEGFMASRYIKSPIGYRAGFEKVNGRWRIFFFLAGD